MYSCKCAPIDRMQQAKIHYGPIVGQCRKELSKSTWQRTNDFSSYWTAFPLRKKLKDKSFAAGVCYPKITDLIYNTLLPRAIWTLTIGTPHGTPSEQVEKYWFILGALGKEDGDYDKAMEIIDAIEITEK